MIAAARRGKRCVQVGTQRRSSPLYRQVFERIRGGAIGKPLYANALYFAERPSVGHREPSSPPAWLDYDLWQGPAPERPYKDNVVHYNWHFFWHWGNGELGNNGVHLIDVCRQALGVDYPSQVTAAGTKLRYDDDQETPDTSTATFDCDGRTIVWEGISWARRNDNSSQIGMTVRGENGEIYVDDDGYKMYDSKGKIVESDKLSRGDEEHLHNFLDAIRNGTSLNAEIEEGHKSALFCHLGNIAYRTGRTLKIDPTNGHIIDNAAAEAMWAREYRDGWIPAA
jgi:predicted dehydrogenase